MRREQGANMNSSVIKSSRSSTFSTDLNIWWWISSLSKVVMVCAPPLTSSSGDVMMMNREILAMRSTVAIREETVWHCRKNKVFWFPLTTFFFERQESLTKDGWRVTL